MKSDCLILTTENRISMRSIEYVVEVIGSRQVFGWEGMG